MPDFNLLSLVFCFLHFVRIVMFQFVFLICCCTVQFYMNTGCICILQIVTARSIVFYLYRHDNLCGYMRGDAAAGNKIQIHDVKYDKAW